MIDDDFKRNENERNAEQIDLSTLLNLLFGQIAVF